MSATPFVLNLVRSQRSRPQDLTTFKYFVCAGAPIPSTVPIEASKVLGVQMLALWGSSESGIITIHRAGDTAEAVSNSDGWRTPPMALKIADETGEPVQTGQTGRLLVKGPSLFRGYYGRTDLRPPCSTTTAGSTLATSATNAQTEASGSAGDRRRTSSSGAERTFPSSRSRACYSATRQSRKWP